MAGYLIKDTTKEEREQIVAESIGNISASCDGCSAGIIEMYQDYIDGKREIRGISIWNFMPDMFLELINRIGQAVGSIKTVWGNYNHDER